MTLVKKLPVLVAGAVAIALLYNVVRLVLGHHTLALDSLGWEIAVIFVMACALIYPVERSRTRGWRLLASLFILAAGVNALLVTFEMLVFTNTTGVGKLLLWWLVRAAGISVVLITSLDKWQDSSPATADTGSPRHSVFGWFWRVAVSVICYTILFMVAGLLIMQLEAVPDYTSPEYAAESTADDPASTEMAVKEPSVEVPAPPVIFGFIWIRGLACILLALPLLKGLAGGRWTAGISIGLALAVLGGIAPLLTPNADMTTGARFGHMLEISWSNFAYGLVIGHFFGNRRPGDWRFWKRARAPMMIALSRGLGRRRNRR